MTSPRSAFGAPPMDPKGPLHDPGGVASGPAKPDPRRPLGEDSPLQLAAMNRLRWSCRRGLLENDLYFERFFRRHGSCLTERNADGLRLLIDLPDNDLLDLLLGRVAPGEQLDRAEVHEVLALMRTDPMTERH